MNVYFCLNTTFYMLVHCPKGVSNVKQIWSAICFVVWTNMIIKFCSVMVYVLLIKIQLFSFKWFYLWEITNKSSNMLRTEQKIAWHSPNLPSSINSKKHECLLSCHNCNSYSVFFRHLVCNQIKGIWNSYPF